MSEQLYYILCDSPHGSDYGLFWKPKSCGYTRIIEKAGKYSEEEAKKICRLRGEEFMVPCELIESKAIRVVDFDEIVYQSGLKENALRGQPLSLIPQSKGA